MYQEAAGGSFSCRCGRLCMTRSASATQAQCQGNKTAQTVRIWPPLHMFSLQANSSATAACPARSANPCHRSESVLLLCSRDRAVLMTRCRGHSSQLPLQLVPKLPAAGDPQRCPSCRCPTVAAPYHYTRSWKLETGHADTYWSALLRIVRSTDARSTPAASILATPAQGEVRHPPHSRCPPRQPLQHCQRHEAIPLRHTQTSET